MVQETNYTHGSSPYKIQSGARSLNSWPEHLSTTCLSMNMINLCTVRNAEKNEDVIILYSHWTLLILRTYQDFGLHSPDLIFPSDIRAGTRLGVLLDSPRQAHCTVVLTNDPHWVHRVISFDEYLILT